MNERDVVFFSQGVRCAATYFPAEGAHPAPGLVLCHGFRGIRRWFQPDLARLFQQAGLSCLTFDYRGFGDSDGQRGRLVPNEQVDDIRSALAFLEQQREVDANKMALFGTSFGASNALHAAALEPTALATACVVGIGDVARAWPAARARLETRLAQDRLERARTGQSDSVDPEEILDNDQSRATFAAAEARFPGLRQRFSLESIARVFEFAPERLVASIAPRAVLFIGAKTDHAVPTEETRHLYDAAGEPKRIEILDAAHYDVYASPVREHVVDVAIDWFREHLRAPSLARKEI